MLLSTGMFKMESTKIAATSDNKRMYGFTLPGYAQILATLGLQIPTTRYTNNKLTGTSFRYMH